MSKIQNDYSCSLILGNDLLGGKWKMRILWHISDGKNRFSKLINIMPDISEKVLYTQLNELVSAKILIKKTLEIKSKHVEYSISQEYNSLISLLENYRDFSIFYAKNNSISVPALSEQYNPS